MAHTQAPETIAQIKAHVPETLRKRSSWIGPVLLAFSGSLYIVTFAGTVLPLPLWLRFLSSVTNAVFIATLFIVGHDACHGSLTPKAWLNKLIGRLSFLPSWHPFVCWDLGHNRIHHSWTNLKGRDYVWTPLSPEEFEALPTTERLKHRFYRTLPGVGVYYLWEVWFKHMMFPRASDRKRLSNYQLGTDISLVALFVGAQITTATTAALMWQTPIWLGLVFSIVLPQLLWNQLMGLVILLHHTHPKVRWFDSVEEWSFFNGQIRGTVHVHFPWPIGAILHHIMDHTAHHVDPRIPLYHLPQAQVAVENSYPEDVIVSDFSWSNLRKVLRECQLYNYRTHQWLPFTHATARAHTSQQYLTVDQASAYLEVAAAEVYRLIERGELSAELKREGWQIDRTFLDRVILPRVEHSTNVLVVDDDTSIQSLLKQLLPSFGCSHTPALNGSEALIAIEAGKIDLVLLDLKLPDISGDLVFEALKSRHPGVPIVIVTGYPDSESLSRVLLHGPLVILKKPFEPQQIGQALEHFKLVRSSKTQKAPTALETSLIS